jgi:hypothetical protein
MPKSKGTARAASAALALLALAAIATTATAAVVQQGNLRITVLAQVQPYKLPQVGTAPIAVFVSGHIDTPAGGIPPQLRKMTIQVNRFGLLQSKGLPTCSLPEVQPASDERALSQCGDALVGSGKLYANVVFPDQRPYPTRGRLLIFNGRVKGKPVLFAHIYTQIPFATSFVITFQIKHIHKGSYGTELSASLPGALGDWGFIDRLKLTLKRKYTYKGDQLSYFNAGCPAPKGGKVASFPLARASFQFSEARKISLTVNKSCGVKE